jgi:hypothetical protein
MEDRGWRIEDRDGLFIAGIDRAAVNGEARARDEIIFHEPKRPGPRFPACPRCTKVLAITFSRS